MDLTTGPVGTAGVAAVPHGRTAQRLDWKFLPKEVRALVEDELGSPVVRAESRTSGFTPGFASVLTAADGSQAFIKAASKIAQAEVAASYSAEIDKVVAFDGAIPAPALEWFSRGQSWVLLGYEAVPSRQPRRPWRLPDVNRALDLAEAVVDALPSTPEGLELRPLIEELPSLVSGWEAVPATWPHRAEAAELASLLRTEPATQVVHADLRDDNILFADDGRTLACDWNWPALGTPWQDSLDLLVSAYGDGIDAEAVLRERRLTAEADPASVDAWLAGVCGFMLEACQRPAPPTSPHLRTHNRWTAEAAWSWLAHRRGWS